MNSALPKAVRKQVEEANRIADEYYKSQQPPADPNAAPANPPADPSAQPNASATPPADPPPAQPVAAQPAQLPQESWEQKYRVLQGKYNAEVPRLQRTVQDQGNALRDLQAQLTTTQNLLASLGAQRGNPPAESNAPAAAPVQPARLVKDEEIREFGADLIDVIRRVAREENSSLLPEIDRRVAPVAQRATEATQVANAAAGRVARNDQQSVLELLNEKVPKWQELNEDPEFLNWLDQRAPYSKQTRAELLTQAYQTHDGPRVVEFFEGYLKEHAAVTPSPTPPAAPAAPQKKLDDFVAPGTPKTGAASTQDVSGKRVWARAEISKFYVDVQQGKYRTRIDEMKKLEADIFAAQKEGRIR